MNEYININNNMILTVNSELCAAGVLQFGLCTAQNDAKHINVSTTSTSAAIAGGDIKLLYQPTAGASSSSSSMTDQCTTLKEEHAKMPFLSVIIIANYAFDSFPCDVFVRTISNKKPSCSMGNMKGMLSTAAAAGAGDSGTITSNSNSNREYGRHPMCSVDSNDKCYNWWEVGVIPPASKPDDSMGLMSGIDDNLKINSRSSVSNCVPSGGSGTIGAQVSHTFLKCRILHHRPY